MPLPLEPFPSYHEGRRTVHRDGHVEVERAYYAVPPEYLAREVWVRWDGRLVRIFNERMQPIAVHTRQEPGRFSTPPQYIASEKISGVERGAAWLLDKVTTRLGPHSTAWAEAMIQARGVEGVRVLQGLLSLAGRHPVRGDRAGLRDRHSVTGPITSGPSERSSKRQAPKQEVLPFLSDHPMIRPMSEYGQFVHDAFQSRNNRVMNQSFLERKGPNRLARPPPATVRTTRRLPSCRRKTRTGLSSGSTRGILPPTFAIASPGQVRARRWRRREGRR